LAKVRYSESAILDKAIAQKLIYDYFDSKQSPVLAEKHINTFNKELDNTLDLLEGNPELFPIREDYYYGKTLRPLRSFSCHWFIVFYVYYKENNEVVIYFIRSSRSDYSNVINMF
jgi:plasmid stabilization system protein ParE